MKYDAEVASAVSRVYAATGISLDPALVQAVIQVETGHQGSGVATNSTGTYYGPMNVRDSTARAYGVSNPATLKDPATGIYYGALALAKMVQKFPGDLAAALSAYESGPGNAVRTNGVFPNQAAVNLYMTVFNQYKRLTSTPAGSAGLATVLLASMVGLFVFLRSRRRRRA